MWGDVLGGVVVLDTFSKKKVAEGVHKYITFFKNKNMFFFLVIREALKKYWKEEEEKSINRQIWSKSYF